MESWRGRGRRAGRDAVAWLAAAWKAGPDSGGGAPAAAGAVNGAGGEMSADAAGHLTEAGAGPAGSAIPGDGAVLGDSAVLGNSAAAGNGAAPERDWPGQADPRPPGRPEQALVRTPGRPEDTAEHNRVPGWLQTGAAWSWRLLLLAGALYLIARVISVLAIVVVPCTAALLLTALLQPLKARLRRAGLHNLAATWCTLLIGALVIGGLVTLVTNRVNADYPVLLKETRHTTTQVQTWLSGAPFHIKSSNVQAALNNIPSYLSTHKALVEGTVVTGGKIAAEFFGGLVLMLFVMFFLIKDGERIWSWLISGLRGETGRRMNRAGHAAWHTMVFYMRGALAVAAIHGVVIGLVLYVMGAPLVIPLAVLVFLAAFVPLIGLLVAGALAIVVVLAAKGWVAAVILLGVLIVEDQLEGHLLQPQVVGRVIRLHPLAVILSLAVGGVLAGIVGAVVAIPMVAVITRAVPELRRGDPRAGGP